MAGRVFLYVQHLLGIGHLQRAARLAKAMAAAGLDVDLVSGGGAVPFLDTGGAALCQLPPLKAGAGGFGDLVDEAGQPAGEALMEERRRRLLAFFGERRPDAVIVETFPFGRRQMRFEVLAFLEAARRADPRPLVISSVRDILQAKRKPGRDAEAADWAETYFDFVLVHGDARFAAFEETFPEAARIAGKLHYTGLIANAPAATGEAGSGEILVSAGGGAVGARLLRTAIEARPLTRYDDAPWRLLAGPNLEAGVFQELRRDAPDGVAVEAYRPDFAALLATCEVSVSQGGYNTVADILAAGARAVIVPYGADGETEQTRRAERLAERGLAHVVDEDALAPHTLARAIDAAATMTPPTTPGIDLDGAAKSARLVAAWLAARDDKAAQASP
ncbi:MAG: glycosyltransferase [Rhodospirillales bacterium]|jgi:predicted glycosyltransferase|nr:glycosyltransferase [Rhodospirillales bacterium]MDP6774275.1 glycosyltransferase [Rhodospirillales bacterium]